MSPGLYRKVDPNSDYPQLSSEGVNVHPSTGISCLVVGGGVGGLTMALESWRKGHTVRVVERSPSPSTAGRAVILISPA